MKLNKTQQDMENIIHIFHHHPEGLSTEQVHKLFEKKYNTKRTKKTIKTRLNDLAAGIVHNVECKIAYRGKHTLKDHRAQNHVKREKAHQKILNKEQLIGEEKAYIRLAMEVIKDLSDLSDNYHEMIEKRFDLNNIKTPYFIESDALESIERKDYDLSELIRAINGDYCIIFDYDAKSSHPSYSIEPYKLIIFDGLWYLYGKDTQESETNPFKTWRLKYVKSVTVLSESKHTREDEDIEKTLADYHSPYTIEGNRETIKIKIHKDAVEKFHHDAHLAGVIDEPILNDDGSLTVTSVVSTFKDIEQDIKKWLPNIEIISPLKYREQLINELKDYVNNLS